MTSFLFGIAFAGILEFASGWLGDRHPVAKVGGWSALKRLTHIVPQPNHIGYGMAFGVLGVWGIPAAMLFAFLFEHFVRPQDNVVAFEVEDVRDVVAGAVLGWMLVSIW